MHEQDYFNEIKSIIENTEVNKRVREYKNNYEDLMSKWNIGKLLVEAQGGEKRAKYGDGLIKKWAEIFSKEYGKQYSNRELRKMRQFYRLFPIWPTLSAKLSWSHIIELLTLQNENERNYYINQTILNNLSIRELRKEIKNQAFERLSYADKENIKLITNEEKNYSLTLSDMIKDPIIIKTDKDINSLNEKAIHKLLIEMIEDGFLELGTGFALVGHEYKIIKDNITYKIDLLFFNVKLNCYIPIEVKNRNITAEDIGQIEFYTHLIDNNVKEKYHNPTIGLILVKKKNQYVLEYATGKNNIFVSSYLLEKI